MKHVPTLVTTLNIATGNVPEDVRSVPKRGDKRNTMNRVSSFAILKRRTQRNARHIYDAHCSTTVLPKTPPHSEDTVCATHAQDTGKTYHTDWHATRTRYTSTLPSGRSRICSRAHCKPHTTQAHSSAIALHVSIIERLEAAASRRTGCGTLVRVPLVNRSRRTASSGASGR